MIAPRWPPWPVSTWPMTSAPAGHVAADAALAARQVARGAPGAGALLLAAARDGGAPSRAYLAARLTGAERRALLWALRDDGDRPLAAERCREAAAELATMTSTEASE